MTTATISPKFQIAIPKYIREIMNLNSGMKFEIIPYDDRIELIPIKKMKEMRGILGEMDTSIKRTKDRI